ncbi:MAG: tripartite tricarboxylate transporter substrate binding protein [Alphaproteobacteria bacterium]|nr:tripartite tricarboxylate transporter substrate binding protein [Alphaproteobacteria bacterium]
MRRRSLLAAGGAALAGTAAAPAIVRAQAWPAREITIIVAVGPGSSADAVARGVARVASKELNATVQVKNVLGGAGLTGFAELAASKPDGYTFGLVNVGGLLVFPHIMKVPYTWDSFSFLGGVAENYFGVGIAEGSPIRTIEDLVAAAKTRRVTYSASAIMNGVAMIQLGNVTGTKFHFVPASTQPEAVAQAVGGHVDVVLQTPPDLVPLIEGGKLRLLASATDRRWPKYPEVRTLKEMGYDAASVVPLGFACPAGVPAEIRARLEQAIAIAAKDAELLATMQTLNIRQRPMSSVEFHDAIKSQQATVEGILVAAGMKKT